MKKSAYWTFVDWCKAHPKIVNIIFAPIVLFHNVCSSRVTMRILQVVSVVIVILAGIAMIDSGKYFSYPVLITIIIVFAFWFLPFSHKCNEELEALLKEANGNHEDGKNAAPGALDDTNEIQGHDGMG